MISHKQFKITPLALEKMKAHLVRSYPKEGCGILVGDEWGSIEEVYSMKNEATAESADGYYEIDPLKLYELERKAEKYGYSVLGFYHSHPDCEARMSSEDSEHMIPQMLYVIASVKNGRCEEIRAYEKDI